MVYDIKLTKLGRYRKYIYVVVISTIIAAVLNVIISL